MPERCLVFGCGTDSLVGIIHETGPSSHDMGVLVIVGGPQYRVGSHRQFVLMARDFCRVGYPVFRFDYRGMGDSEGAQRTFEDIQQDIQAALDAFFSAIPTLRKVCILGLCDAASAAMIFCLAGDPRVSGLILANPWVRTEAGEARAYVQHYYWHRLWQRSFWAKLASGEFDIVESLKSLASILSRSLRGRAAAHGEPGTHFTRSMLLGLERYRGRILFLISGRDLTAREFDEFSGRTDGWAEQLASSRVARVDFPHADHTFSSRESLKTASEAVVAWLDASR